MTRIYQAHRDQWDRVHCTVHTGGSHTRLDNVGYHSPAGYEMGYRGSAPRDLALSILLDYLAVDFEYAREVFVNGFRTGDVRLLYAWMARDRLVEQLIGDARDYFQVDEWELNRLLRTGFLTDGHRLEFERRVSEREGEDD